MVFSSFIFILGFMPVTLMGFWLLSKADHRYSKAWLCLVSLVFYAWWDWHWLVVLLVSVCANYLAGLSIIARANSGRRTGAVLFAAIAANLLALTYYKYLFSVLQFFHAGQLIPLSRGLPLGISFFTFTQIAFLIDVSQGFRERYTPLNYLLFVTFFPHLIAGPIVHHRDLMPQFEEDRNYRLQPREFAIGLAIFSLGLAKKTLLADRLAGVANTFLGAGHVSPHAAWIGVLAYYMQLYFDFSGYSDMAIGLARLFGIKFPLNFDSPYKATNIIEFWQRWHITLTRFLTAYLYNPIALALVRRRAAAGRSTSKRASATPAGFLELIALPTLVTMLLAGIWHGAGLQFVVFGLLHGLYITVNHAWRTFGPKQPENESPQLRWLRSLVYGGLVFLCVLTAQIFFRADSVTSALNVLADMTGLRTGPMPQELHLAALDGLTMLACMGIVWFMPNTQQLMADFDPALSLGRTFDGSPVRIRFTPAWALVLGVVLFLGLIDIVNGQPFIYFQF